MKLGTIMIAAALGATSLAARPGKNAKDAAALYREKCSSCHGKDGKATGFIAKRVHAADLTSPAIQGLSDEQIAEIIKNGKGKMPAFAGKLTDQEIHELVAYLRQLGGK